MHVSPAKIDESQGIVGHWKLQGDCLDYSGKDNHGINHGVDLESGQFDGSSSFLEVPADESLRFGSGDFSICAWICMQQDMDGVVGDLLSKYDSVQRRGFTLSIKASSGGYNSQGNDKHLYFGIDDGSEITWTDCGRPSEISNFANSLTVYDGHLYVGTTDATRKEDWCHVYRYAGGTQWQDCGRVGDLKTKGVGALIVHNGDLYAATWNFNWPPDEAKEHGHCHVYRYGGGAKWEDCGQPGLWGMSGYSGFWSMASYRGNLYVLGCGPWDRTDHVKSKCYVYEGNDKWTICGEWDNTHGHPMAVHHGKLYTGVHGAEVCVFDGQQWENLGNPLGSEKACDQIHSMEVYRGELHVGTWPRGNVVAHRNGQWVDCGPLGQSTEPNGLTVYNGKLFAGSLPWAEVYRYDDGEGWTPVRRFHVDDTPDFTSMDHFKKWVRLTSLTVFDGKLFASTSSISGSVLLAPCDIRGKVFCAEAGKCVSYDRELGCGPKHIAAVKEGGLLKLYIDGELAVTSKPFKAQDFDLSNTQPLEIGFGETDCFSGRMQDVRLYNRALTGEQIRHTYRETVRNG